tara:strand:- start:34862 stop:34969 length:108 start_codon:yes stop_codon:yes gene_type:complete
VHFFQIGESFFLLNMTQYFRWVMSFFKDVVKKVSH